MAKIKYSPTEDAVLSILKDGNVISSADLAARHYGRKAPLNARNTIVGIVRSLTKKSKMNREPFTIKRFTRRGPHPIEFWIEER